MFVFDYLDVVGGGRVEWWWFGETASLIYYSVYSIFDIGYYLWYIGYIALYYNTDTVL